MAKKDGGKKNTGADYGAETRLLRENGPQRLYLLYGEESYLCGSFLSLLRKCCLCDGDESFNLRRLSPENSGITELREAVEALPFFSERTFVELRDWDINRIKDDELSALTELLSDIPDYCTVCFVQRPGYAPDGRLSFIKFLKKAGRALDFQAQEQRALTLWITKRFAAAKKSISRDDAEYLLFAAGTLMNRLISEIDKLSSLEGDTVTRADIDRIVERTPEARVFDLVDALAAGNNDSAAALLSGIIAAREEPIMILALIGTQYRRMYTVRLCMDEGRSRQETLELSELKYDSYLSKAQQALKKYSTKRLAEIIGLCAEYDYKMKSSGIDSAILLREFFAVLAAGEKC